MRADSSAYPSVCTLDAVRAAGRMVCGVLSGFEPFGFIDPATGQPAGYEIDFARELARHLGVALELAVVTPAARIPALLSGEVDVLAALLAYNPERAQQVDFSGIYSRDANQLLVRGDAGWTGADQLATARFGALAGTSLPAVLTQRYPGAGVEIFDSPQAAHAALADGRIDAVFLRTTSLIALRDNPLNGVRTRILPEILLAPESSFVLRRADRAFREAIDAFLLDAEQSGLAQRLFDRWLGRHSRYGMTRDFRVGMPVAG